ncbi:sigma-70 family RNA polymerase sigma factor [Haloechinothrix halophila]|uniref:sigma-70 family RNA polymerase sigma factor n=1 Tax=Haloechinothrix halophila TaxID=1069073 RepID=UPI0003FA7BF7|nr:sigma-70 family RNA polymerase sigma factor [Haloechinothrix halophila]
MPGQDFIDFFRRHYDWVRRYASRYQSLDADELAHLALVRVWLNWEDFNPRKPRAWLKTVVNNAALDEMRRQQRTHVDADVDVEAAVLVATRQDDPAEQAVWAERLEQLLELLHELPQQQRVLLERKFLDEASYDVLSDEFGISYNAVRQRVHRALKKLTELAKKRRITCLALPITLGSMLSGLRRMWMSAPTGFATSAGAVVFAVGYGTGIFGPETGTDADITMRTPTVVAPSTPSAGRADPPIGGSVVPSTATSAASPPPVSSGARAPDGDRAPPPRPPMTASVDIPPPDTGPGKKQSHDVRIPTPAGDVTTDNEVYSTGPLVGPACDSEPLPRADVACPQASSDD